MNSNERNSLANYLGGISSAIRSKKRDPNYTINAANFADEIRALDKSPKVLDGTLDVYDNNSTIGKVREGLFSESEDLESISLGMVTGPIEKKAFYGIETLEEVNIAGCGGVEESAFEGCKNLTTINLGVVNGVIGKNAFKALENVEHFTMDPASNVTELSAGCFAGIGYNRSGNERFIFDFRNSTFKQFYGFDEAGDTSNSSGGFLSTSSTAVSLAVSNIEIRLPNTIEYIGPKVTFADFYTSDSAYLVLTLAQYYGQNPSSMTVLNGADNVDIFISNGGININSTEVFPRDENSHVFIAYEFFGEYLEKTNWCALKNLYGFATYANNATLPTTTLDGHSIEWFANRAMSASITKGNGGEVYCRYTGTRNKVRIISRAMLGGHVTITGGGRSYSVGDLVDIGTTLTITAVSDTAGQTNPKYFSVFPIGGNPPGNTVTFVVRNTTDIKITLSYTVGYLLSGYEYFEKDGIALTYLSASADNLIPAQYITAEGLLCNVVCLKNAVFNGSQPTKNITVPNTVRYLHDPARSTTYDSNGAFYIYNRSAITNPACPQLIVSENVELAGPSCFAYYDASFIDLKNIKRIESSALVCAISKESDSIVLPASLEVLNSKISTMGENARNRTYSRDSYSDFIYNIYYNGTFEQWCNIERGIIYLLAQVPLTDAIQPKFYIYDENGNITYHGKTYKECTEFIIPNTITEIKENTFSNTRIKVFTIPNTIEKIEGVWTFATIMTDKRPAGGWYSSYDSNMSSDKFEVAARYLTVYYNGTLTDWFNNVTDESALLSRCEHFYYYNPNGNVTHNGKTYTDLFASTAITLPNSIKKIPNGAFKNTNIQSISMPNVTEIGKYAFYKCTALSSVSMPAVRKIKEGAFKKCTSLRELTSITCDTIAFNAFSESGLQTISLNGNIAKIEKNAFANCPLTSVSIRSEAMGSLIDILSDSDNPSLVPDIYVPKAQFIRHSLFYKAAYPANIPEGCREYYFSGYETSISIPLSLESCGYGATGDVYPYIKYKGPNRTSAIPITFAGTMAELNYSRRANLKNWIKNFYYKPASVPAPTIVCTDGTVTL